jgi:hypothetical protein
VAKEKCAKLRPSTRARARARKQSIVLLSAVFILANMVTQKINAMLKNTQSAHNIMDFVEVYNYK